VGSSSEAGNSRDRVKASRFSSTPKFGIWGEKARGYRGGQPGKVAVQNEKELQIAASAVDSLAQVQFVGAEFERGQRSFEEQGGSAGCENAQ